MYKRQVHADVLHQLVVGRERFQTLLTLVRFVHFGTSLHFSGVHLHRGLVHEQLRQQSIIRHLVQYLYKKQANKRPTVKLISFDSIHIDK